MNREIGRVELSGESNEVNKIISADAVRFGGGVGVIERGGSTSGRPKFVGRGEILAAICRNA